MSNLTFDGLKVVSGDLETQAGNIISSGDVTAGDDIVAAGDITATTGNITATAGNIVATAGDVTAGDDVIATDDITAGGDITATAGNIAATAGSVTAGTTVTATTDASVGRHYLATGSVPAAAAGAGAGSSPPAPVVTAGDNDTRGNITWGTGTTAAAGAQVAVTFATAFAAAPFVAVTPRNTATEALGLYVSTKATTGFTLASTGAPADSQANTVYSFDYIVIG